jgi:hypothetical protein
MRIIICIFMVFFFPITMNVKAAELNYLDYKLNCLVTPGPEKVYFEINLENRGQVPLHFEFPTSKAYEILVTDEKGEVVYLYSKGRSFLQAFQTITVEPHKTYKRTENWNYQFNGKRVPQGEYNVRTVLLPSRINDEPVKDRNSLTCRMKLSVPKENTVFRKVKAEGQTGHYLIKGETRAKTFFYTVEDGHRQLLKEQKILIQDNDTEWKTFSIPLNLSPDSLPENGTIIMNIYERSQAGQIQSNFPVSLERFQ